MRRIRPLTAIVRTSNAIIRPLTAIVRYIQPPWCVCSIRDDARAPMPTAPAADATGRHCPVRPNQVARTCNDAADSTTQRCRAPSTAAWSMTVSRPGQGCPTGTERALQNRRRVLALGNRQWHRAGDLLSAKRTPMPLLGCRAGGCAAERLHDSEECALALARGRAVADGNRKRTRSSDTQQTTDNRQRAASNMQHLTCNMQHATDDGQPAPCGRGRAQTRRTCRTPAVRRMLQDSTGSCNSVQDVATQYRMLQNGTCCTSRTATSAPGPGSPRPHLRRDRASLFQASPCISFSSAFLVESIVATPTVLLPSRKILARSCRRVQAMT
jgi:hypothetical protein